MNPRKRLWRFVYYAGLVGCLLTLISLTLFLNIPHIGPIDPPATRFRRWAELCIGILLDAGIERTLEGHAFALLAVGSLTAFAFFRSRQQRLPNHCRSCNYNLTGNTTGRCPECGTAAGA